MSYISKAENRKKGGGGKKGTKEWKAKTEPKDNLTKPSTLACETLQAQYCSDNVRRLTLRDLAVCKQLNFGMIWVQRW